MKKKLMGVMLFVLGALVVVVFQQIGQTAPALTALDYAEIHQLYAQYAVGVDSLAQDGEMFASVFTNDGEVGRARGHDQLLEMADRLKRDRAENGIAVGIPIHYLTNLYLMPTADGATGVAYHLGMRGEEPDTLIYHDELVKTPEGWRFKKRSAGPTFSDELLQALAQ